MSNLTINPSSKGGSPLNVLFLNESSFGKKSYERIVEQQKGSLTQNYVADVIDIYSEALFKLESDTEPLQIEILRTFAYHHDILAKTIDPNRHDFTITTASDGEICINRKVSNGGRVKIIIHDEGLIAFSYLPGKLDPEKERLDFFNYSKIDIEKLLYNFFAL